MKKRKLLPLVLSLIALLPVLTGTAFGSIIPTLKETLALKNIQVSLILTTSTLITVLASPFIGKLSDKFQPRKMIRFLLMFYILGALINSLSIVLKDYNYGLFVAGRLFQGIGNIGAGPIAVSLVNNLSDESSSYQNIALVQSFTSSGAVVGPIVGSIFALYLWNGLFIFDMTVMLGLVILLSSLLASDNYPSEDRFATNFAAPQGLPKNGKIKWVAYLGGFGLMFSLVGMQSFLVDYLINNYDVSVFWGGMIVSIHALMMASTAGISGRFLTRERAGKLIISGMAIYAVAMLFVGLRVNFLLTTVVIILGGVGCGLILPSGNILVIANSARQEQSYTISLFSSACSLGVLCGSFLLGAISTYFNYQMMFFSSGMILLILFAYNLYSLRKFNNQQHNHVPQDCNGYS